MIGFVACLGLLAGVTDVLEAPPKQFRIELKVCQGDPLGSRNSGTVTYLAESSAVVRIGQPMSVQTDGPIAVRGPDGKVAVEPVGIMVELTPTAWTRGWIEVKGHLALRSPSRGLAVTLGSAEVSPGVTERMNGVACGMRSGECVKIRLAADSPSNQTWVEAVVSELPPGGK